MLNGIQNTSFILWSRKIFANKNGENHQKQTTLTPHYLRSELAPKIKENVTAKNQITSEFVSPTSSGHFHKCDQIFRFFHENIKYMKSKYSLIEYLKLNA